jgi:hypothetical protein
MLPNTQWEAAHLAILYAQTLALRKIFKADQIGMNRRRSCVSKETSLLFVPAGRPICL